MVRIYYIFAFLLFSAFSCSKEEVEPVEPLESYPVPVTRVDAPETAAVGSTVPLTVYFVVNNSCGEFRTFEVEEKAEATYVKVYPKYRDGPCLMYLPTREVNYTFKPDKPGTYTFKFFSDYPDVYITKTIVVENGN